MQCKKCLLIKTDSDFHKDRSRPNGLHPYCKDCLRSFRPKYATKKQRGNKSYQSHLARENKRYRDNKEAFKEQRRQYYQQNKELVRARAKRYRELNQAKRAAWNSARRARKQQATPPWYKQEKHAIIQLYTEAAVLTRETGVQYTVDHIVPLTSDVVCGLHCLSNLQLMTKSANSSKRNRFIGADRGP